MGLGEEEPLVRGYRVRSVQQMSERRYLATLRVAAL